MLQDPDWVIFSLFLQTNHEQGQLEEKGQNQVIHYSGNTCQVSQIEEDTTEKS